MYKVKRTKDGEILILKNNGDYTGQNVDQNLAYKNNEELNEALSGFIGDNPRQWLNDVFEDELLLKNDKNNKYIDLRNLEKYGGLEILMGESVTTYFGEKGNIIDVTYVNELDNPDNPFSFKWKFWGDDLGRRHDKDILVAVKLNDGISAVYELSPCGVTLNNPKFINC